MTLNVCDFYFTVTQTVSAGKRTLIFKMSEMDAPDGCAISKVKGEHPNDDVCYGEESSQIATQPCDFSQPLSSSFDQECSEEDSVSGTAI